MWAYLRDYLGRLAQRVVADRSAAGLLACNVVALAIAIFHPPITIAVMLLYWAECAIIGALNFAKLYYVPFSALGDAERARMGRWERLAFTHIGPAFFLAHYGGFLFVLFAMMKGLGDYEMRERGQPEYDILGHLGDFWPALLMISAGHLVSFFRNYLGRREYQGRSYEDQMLRPYRRVFLMVFVMWAGYIVVALTRLPELALLVFVPFKIIFDLEAHFRAHDVNLSLK